MKVKLIITGIVALALTGVLWISPVFSINDDEVHKVAFQITENNPKKMNLVLNNAFNVIKYYGVGNVEVEIVAYGKGLDIFHKDTVVADRLRGLHAFGGVTYAVCKNTMKKRKIKMGDLLNESFVQDAIVPAGVVRLMELQQQGYSYIRP